MTLEFDEICDMSYSDKKQLSKHFNLVEFTNSVTAAACKINNTPSPQAINSLCYLCEVLLEPLRERVGKPFYVTSGFRCPKLNKKVGGVKNSAHMYGLAADISLRNLDGNDLFTIYNFLKTNLDVPFDQVILEYKFYDTGVHNSWLHLSVADPAFGYNHRQLIGFPSFW